MKYSIFKNTGPMTHHGYRWHVDEYGFFHSAHATWADAMRAVDEAYRTITVTLPPYRDRYTTEDIGKAGPVAVETPLNGWAKIRYIGGGAGIRLRPEEIEPVALALLAIDKHNKEKKQ